MKAWVLHDIGALAYEETERPRPEKGEVLVAVKAAGVCGSDIPRIYRDGAHRMPLIPGHEFAGRAVETGSGVDRAWIGKRVGVFPLIPCRACIACRKGRYEMCRQYGYLGSRRDGGFAEYVSVPADNLIELPENVSYEQAAMLEPLAVAAHAIGRVGLHEEDTVAVCGLGTIGLLLVMLLLERGARKILAVGNKDHQKKQALMLGILPENFCESREEDVKEWISRRSEGAGADVFFECVGKNETISQAVDLTAPGGRVCMVGNPDTDVALSKPVYWKILRNQLLLTGTWNSSFFDKKGAAPDRRGEDTDWGYVLSLLESGRIAPQKLISHRFALEELDRGLRIMRDKSEDYLKVMTVSETPDRA